MGKLDGKVALVTGASSGIGYATAKELASQGAAVAVAARRLDRLTALVSELESTGANALAIECDVTNEKDVMRAAEETINTLGRIDILVNSAGNMLLAPFGKGRSDDWEDTYDLNVMGTLYPIKAVVPHMKEHGGGHIVNVSSTASKGGRPGNGAYAGAKAAINTISESMRQEFLADNIRITVVVPGGTETELPTHIRDEGTKEGMQKFLSSIQLLKAEDVARSISYAVEQPDYISVNELVIRPTQQPF